MDKKDKIKQIEKVSSSFCLAKWTQVTLDLVHGTTHSCHHPKRHPIDEEAVKTNPSLLHNTPQKKEARKLMLEGVRPPECEYCWNIEDSVGTHHSDRFVKSLDPWSWPYFDQVIKAGADQNYAPHYLEVMFDNACNFACGYCLGDISTSIKKEMETFGPYKVKEAGHRMPDPEWQRDYMKNKEENPFTKAFWEWLPEIWENLHVLRVTGGEPFLSKHTFRLLEYCLENPRPELSLAFNSNLGLSRDRILKFQALSQRLFQEKALKSQELYVSVDSVGEQAEYIRQGLVYDQFLHNLQIFLEDESISRITIMCTFSLLSLPLFDQFIEEIENLKGKYSKLVLDVSYLKEPSYLKASLADEKLKEPLFRANKRVQESTLFDDFEKNKVGRIASWLKATQSDDEEGLKGDFFSFVNDYDQRYHKNFLETFPQMRDFLISAKKDRFLTMKKRS